MKKIRLFSFLLVMCMIFTLLAGCSGNTPTESTQPLAETPKDSSSSVDTTSSSITLAVTYSGDVLEQFRELITGFQNETGIQVDLTAPGDYESTLKTMMASNTLPDVFMTHGWSLRRYSEYLKPVNSQPWFSSIDESLLPIMADEDGNVYAMCVSTSVSGVYFNRTVLNNVGIDPYSITTWDDFEKACAAVKATGKTAIAVGGASGSGQFASIFGGIAPTLWTDKGAKYDLASVLLDGSFDSKTYVTEMFQMIGSWLDSGYFNEDCLTLDFDGASRMLGCGDAAFMLRGPLSTAHSAFPDADLGIVPMPASVDGAKPSFRLGEGNAFGVWKDTENETACWTLLEYLSRPENVAAICGLGTDFPSVEGVEATDAFGFQIYNDALAAYSDNVQFDNLFDRKYMPNGMWSVLGESLSIIFDNTANIPEAVESFESAYLEKISE